MAEVTHVNVTQGLPPMYFRGLIAPPYDDATFGFKHRQPANAYPNIDGASHDGQGMEPHDLKFKLYFLNTLYAGTNVFPGLWNRWWTALKDNTPGEMEHPILGKRDVVVDSGSVALTARVTSGVIVDVTFHTTILDPEATAQDFKLQVEVKALAKAADVKAETAEIPMPSGVVESSLFELVGQLDGFLFAIENQALGIVNKTKGVIESMVDFIDARDPRQTVMQARDALLELWVALDDLAVSTGKKLRPIEFETLVADTSLDAFARSHKNELAEVIELNPLALLSPTVSKGTVMQFYA